MRRGALKGTSRAALFAAIGLATLGITACQEEEQGSTLRIATVTTRDIIVSASASGAVEPVTTVEVKSQASGEIIEVMVEDGDEVTRGQLLSRVDARIPARLDRAEQLHAAQAIARSRCGVMSRCCSSPDVALKTCCHD